MKKQFTLILVSMVLFLSTCTKDIGGPDGCFKEDVLPIFVSNCSMAGCHNSTHKAAGYDLTNYEGIMRGIKPKHPLNSEIYNTISGNNPSMPQNPYPKLSAKDVNMIKLWINMGARNSSNCKSCDTTNFTYSERIKNTMQVWCVGCHNGNSTGGGFDLSNYNGVIISIANNKLLGSIKHLSGFSSMPKNTNQLPKCEIDAIEKWINDGYPNN